MQRYYFHMVDGQRDEDRTGMTFPDDRAAFREAVRFAGLSIARRPELLERHLKFAVEVTGDDDELLFVLTCTAWDANSPVNY